METSNIETESSRRELANDPKRKARSDDPGWKYAYYPIPEVNKDVVKCILCGNQNHGAINRFKQHLIGGCRDIVKCPKTNKEIANEMIDYIQSKKKNKKQHVIVEEDSGDEVEEIPSSASNDTMQSSSLVKKGKAAMSFFKKPTTNTKSVASTMYMRSPEQVVEDRHGKGASQTTLENRLRTPAEKERVHLHIANFFYECGIPFDAAHSKSYEVMIESIGQYGSGLKPPTYDELRVPQLKKAKDEIEKLKENHEKAWKRYGCTLLLDGWTYKQGKHLINFLANSPEGTFFLGFVNASSESHDAHMLASLLENKIKEIGEKNVVQVVTNNGVNYKLVGQVLENRIPTLFWTPCVAHCIDLMLEDIGNIKGFKTTINQAKRCTTFIYRHGRVLDSLREKTNERDLVKAGATRFVTTFLTLQSLQKHREALCFLFCAEHWSTSKLSKTENGQKVYDIVFSSLFWNTIDECVNASQPLLQVLRISNGDEKPALAEVAYAMEFAKSEIKKMFGKDKLAIQNKVVKIIEDRWSCQMGNPLYGTALFLNPGRYFDLLEKDHVCASQIREDFNDVLEKMVTDRTTRNAISNSADDYKNTRRGFAREMAIEHRKEKSPLDWWDAYGGRAIELQAFAKRIVGLCCSSSGCERNWSTFEFIHTKKRNMLEYQHLDDLVYVQYNRKIDARFKKRCEIGSKFDPLVLEDLEWSNEWITNVDDRFWSAVDIALGVSNALEGCNLPRGARGDSTSDMPTYTRRATSSTPHDPNDEDVEDEDNAPVDDDNVEDDYGVPKTIEENTQGGDGDEDDYKMDDY